MSYAMGPLRGESVSDVEAANFIKLPGVWTVATLPPFTSVGPGCLAYTTDQGYMGATATGWASISATC